MGGSYADPLPLGGRNPHMSICLRRLAYAPNELLGLGAASRKDNRTQPRSLKTESRGVVQI